MHHEEPIEELTRTTKPPATSDTNSKRHIVSTSLGHVTELLLAYDAAEKGACQGDSGGPWLVGTGADVRVVGIDSYGNTTCDGLAVAGRVQAGLDFFSATSLFLFGLFIFFLFGCRCATSEKVSKTKRFLCHFRLLFFQVSF